MISPYIVSFLDVSLTLFGEPGPEVIKPFSCSTQLRLKVILLINVKMPTIVGILTFISRIKAVLFFYLHIKFPVNLAISIITRS